MSGRLRSHRFSDGLVRSAAVERDARQIAPSLLRRVGQRFTPNRRAIVEVLEMTGKPLTITEILAARPGLPQSSVYRNLVVLERVGIVRRISGADEFSRYELAENLIGHHHHLVCSSCGAVEDFTASRRLELAVASTIDEVGARSGFSTDGHHLQLTGLCRSCS
jgi:Fur family ferric uptake transcriptional regulator